MAGLLRPVPLKWGASQQHNGHNVNEPPGRILADGLSSKLIYPRRGADLEPPSFWHLHGAQDIPLPIGTAIFAPETGIIVQQGEIARFGDGSIDGELYTILQIHRDATSQTLIEMTHLSKFLFKVGQRVKRGQVLVRSGNTGRSTGPHLHWQVCTGPRSASPAAIVWGSVGTRRDPNACLVGGALANRSFLKPNV